MFKGHSNRCKHERKLHPGVIIPDGRKTTKTTSASVLALPTPNAVVAAAEKASVDDNQPFNQKEITPTSATPAQSASNQHITTYNHDMTTHDLQTDMHPNTAQLPIILVHDLGITTHDHGMTKDDGHQCSPLLLSATPISPPESGEATPTTTTEVEPASVLPSESIATPESSSTSDSDKTVDVNTAVLRPGSPAVTINTKGSQLESDTGAPQSPDLPATEQLRSVSDDDVDVVTAPFIQWLSQPPATPMEQLIKARRARTEQQVQPVRKNLRFLFASLLHDRTILRVEDIQLELFERLDICKAVRSLCVYRQIKAERMYTLFLLIKKVLVYLTQKKSYERKEWLRPDSIPSFPFVDSVAMEATEERKRDALNRQVFGKGGRKRPVEIQDEQGNEPPATRPRVDNNLGGNTVMVHRGHQISARPGAREFFSAAVAAAAFTSPPIICGSRSGPAENTRAALPLLDSAGPMSKAELQAISTHGLRDMLQLETEFSQASSGENFLRARGHEYMALLVTSVLCLCLAPRSQVLKELRIGESLKQVVGQDGTHTYRAEIRAEQNKNQRPTLVPFPEELTAHMDFYITMVRPALLRGALANKPELASNLAHTYLFFKRSGEGPRTDFSKLTQTVTGRIIGRPINAHEFRAAVITTFYENGATQAGMTNLATVMAHDATTARKFYYRPQLSQAAAAINREMASVLLGHSG